jgi:hypothetical protein
MIARAAALTTALLLVCCTGGPLKNVNCEWPANHSVNALDLAVSRDARHLADDAQTAEDLAIRHADASRGRASQSRDATEYQAVREQCKASLFALVASQHHVSMDAVAAAVGDRREWLDALVILGFAIVFALVANQVSAFMLRGALVDSRLLAVSMLIVAALAAGGAGLLVGNVWFGLIESLRVGNGHMSYRAERIPIRRHREVVFVACATVFAAVSTVQYRKARS